MAYLAVVVGGELAEALDAVLRERTLRLVLRSIGLAASVTSGTLALALPLSLLTVRTDQPGHPVWKVF